jgi:hypothetical protein
MNIFRPLDVGPPARDKIVNGCGRFVRLIWRNRFKG